MLEVADGRGKCCIGASFQGYVAAAAAITAAGFAALVGPV
jgi:hypothetical protein